MVEHPQRIQAFHLRNTALLPVKPPEIHPFFFIGMVRIFKIGGKECRIRNFKRHRLFPGYILPQFLCHSLIHFLMRADSVCRMHIQCNSHTTLMQAVHKSLRIREKLPVPCIACPAGSIFGIDIYQMPVHINDCNCKRDSLFIETVHQLQITRFGIFIVTAPPVPQCEPGQHGGFTAKIIKILQTFQIVQPVTPEINILNSFFAGCNPSFLGKNK